MKHLLTFLVLLSSFVLADAQALTTAQIATLRTDILADATLAPKCVPYGDGPYDITAAYNLPKSPTFYVWKTSVNLTDIVTSAAWDWTRVDNLSVGKARIWEWMFKSGSIDASQSNVRAGIDATWVGTQADLNVRAAVYTMLYQPATRMQALFATGTGTTGAPATMAVTGSLQVSDTQKACSQ